MDIGKSTTKGASVGSPMDVLRVVVRALRSVISSTEGEVYVPGGLEFEPQRLRGFFGFPRV